VADETKSYPENFPPCDCWTNPLGGAALSSLSGHLPDCYVHALIMEAMKEEPGPIVLSGGMTCVPVGSFEEVTEALNNGYPATEHVDVQHWGPGPNLSPLPQLADEFALHSIQADADQPERVPLVVRVWSGRLQHRFEPFPDAPDPVAVEVPVGWHLVPDHRAGVVLMNVWGDVLCAGDVLNWAQTGSGSFRLAPEAPVPLLEPGDAPG
jgi:hypothetical protein